MDKIKSLHVKLRLRIAQTFTRTLRDAETREKLAHTFGWTPQSPIVPCEYDTQFSEVIAMVQQLGTLPPETVFMCPVLETGREYEDVKLHLVSITECPSAESINSIRSSDFNHSVSMGQLIEVLAPNKSWDISDLEDVHESLSSKLALNY